MEQPDVFCDSNSFIQVREEVLRLHPDGGELYRRACDRQVELAWAVAMRPVATINDLAEFAAVLADEMQFPEETSYPGIRAVLRDRLNGGLGTLLEVLGPPGWAMPSAAAQAGAGGRR